MSLDVGPWGGGMKFYDATFFTASSHKEATIALKQNCTECLAYPGRFRS